MKEIIEKLDLALQAGKTRYSREQGEPQPTPAFPVEVAFTMSQWDDVLKALGELLNTRHDYLALTPWTNQPNQVTSVTTSTTIHPYIYY